jgi:hypothetical protein
MPLTFARNEVALTGACGAEEALDLAEWLAKRKRPRVNLAACTHLHAALLHTLLIFRPSVCAGPADPFLSRWVMPLLHAARDPAELRTARSSEE